MITRKIPKALHICSIIVNNKIFYSRNQCLFGLLSYLTLNMRQFSKTNRNFSSNLKIKTTFRKIEKNDPKIFDKKFLLCNKCSSLEIMHFNPVYAAFLWHFWNWWWKISFKLNIFNTLTTRDKDSVIHFPLEERIEPTTLRNFG